ncbi:hypothetical protein AKA01nite_15680 [Alkalibacterium kapii]|uniref:Uncharacterized protein n=1 Tax=Alkalibacterium kapii TaxID=426704 RepID=A0A511AUW7_9LACT|nr:hypothetical protein AKA01nite_15680 [Alkalibacterium kapii]
MELFRQRNSAMTCVLTGEDKVVTLLVEESDLVVNADGEIDCSLETILRKNKVSTGDIHEWKIQRIQIIEVIEGKEKVIREYNPEMVLSLLQV